MAAPNRRPASRSHRPKPGRTLLVFLAVLVGLFAVVASLGTWKPNLGLDLQGGTRIMLQAQAEGPGGVTASKLNQAVDIISQRVNGAGVAEASVSTQGSDIIVVEIPGQERAGLASSVGETAQLRFRIVLASQLPAANQQPQTIPTQPSATGTPSQPSTPTTSSQSGPSATSGSTSGPTTGNTTTTSRSSSPAPTGSTTSSSPKPSGGQSSTTANRPALQLPPRTDDPGAPPPWLTAPDLYRVPEAQRLTWKAPAELQQKFQSFQCPSAAHPSTQVDLPGEPLMACDGAGNRYLLGPAVLEGTAVTDAAPSNPNGLGWQVDMNFNGPGGQRFGEITNYIKRQGGTNQQMAIVLDGEVVSAPGNDQAIYGGRAQISGGTPPFNQQTATMLANQLKYGALPLQFTELSTSQEGPQLASNQLGAGITAGLIGLLLVVVYCLAYYRGLGLVVIASLVAAGALTYACVLLLGHSAGFTLTLPGIAGLIVAIGITADSFIVYFERLRDEVREGKSLRSGVESGWVRARMTILAADAVSFLAAVVLFIFAIGVVKGFAFALGLTTLIDVFVVFFFTKPIVSLLARTEFFGHGHKFSGLDRRHLGMATTEEGRA